MSRGGQTGRKLRLRARAASMEETRRRIVRAALELHAAVGPARTTVSAVAERAGVQRHTVYQHFPDPLALAGACTAYGLSLDPQPDPAALTGADPEARLREGLTLQYGYYRRNEALLANALRDTPAMQERLRAAGLDWAAVPEVVRGFFEQPARLRDALAAGWAGRGTPPAQLNAALGLAVDFWTWRTLARGYGMSDAAAADLVTRLVTCAAPNAPPEGNLARRGSGPPGAG